jgi:hypothetical protein
MGVEGGMRCGNLRERSRYIWKKEKRQQDERRYPESPEVSANVVSQALFLWTSSLYALGLSQALQQVSVDRSSLFVLVVVAVFVDGSWLLFLLSFLVVVAGWFLLLLLL